MRQRRELEKQWRMLANTIAAGLGFYLLYAVIFRTPRHVLLSVYFGLTLVLVFLYFPASKRSPLSRPSAVDLVWIAATLAPTVYYPANFMDIFNRAGLIHPPKLILGAVLVAASFEACRRALGIMLPLLGTLFIAYAIFGQQLPGVLTHAGISPRRMMDSLYGFEGVYGIVTRTFATFALPFIILSAFLERMGTGGAFIRLAMRGVGRRVGGPAKASVLASGLTGSIIGAGAGNIAVTGTFTIPLMKRAGAKPHEAAAIETVASIGGHMVPPIMGSAAFVMASLTGISYSEIVLVSIAPALLLYLALYAQVHLKAKKLGWESVASDDGTVEASTLANDLLLLIPLVALIGLIIIGYSPFLAAIGSILISIALSRTQPPEFRLYPSRIFESLAKGTLASLGVGATAGVMGVIVAVITLTGTASRAASWIVHLSGGSLIAALLLVAIASYILGMGLTATAAYILIAVVAAPALVALGVPLIAAHMTIMWLSQDSSFTPPFAIGALIAAGLADADPMKTAWAATWFGKIFYIMPVLIVWTPLLAGDGFNRAFWATFAAAILGMLVLAVVSQGYLYQRLRPWEYVSFSGALFLLLWPSLLLSILGAALVALGYRVHRSMAHKAGAFLGTVSNPDTEGALA